MQREDTALRVSASATLQADARTVWDTLIGYERLPDFIPDMTASRTLQRDGDDALVEQRGRAGFGPIQRDFSLTLAVHEQPLQTVTARAVVGDFSRFESSYRLIAPVRCAAGGDRAACVSAGGAPVSHVCFCENRES